MRIPLMKTMTILLMMATLAMGCRHLGPDGRVSEAHFRQQIVGTWWSGDRWITEPFSFVTFFPDGRFTRSSTNGQIASMPTGYWRVGHTNGITFTVERDTLPAASFMVFRVDHITDHSMVFTNRVEGRRISFTR